MKFNTFPYPFCAHIGFSIVFFLKNEEENIDYQ